MHSKPRRARGPSFEALESRLLLSAPDVLPLGNSPGRPYIGTVDFPDPGSRTWNKIQWLPWQDGLAAANVGTSGADLTLTCLGGSGVGAQVEAPTHSFGFYSAQFMASAPTAAPAGVCNAFFYYYSDTQEIDVEVLSNRPDCVYFTVEGGDSFRVAVPNQSAQYHSYGFDWESGSVTFYLDGSPAFGDRIIPISDTVLQAGVTATTTVNVPPDNGAFDPGWLILSNWSGHVGWSGSAPVTDEVMYVHDVVWPGRDYIPVVTTTSGALDYHQGAGAAAVDAGIADSDPDNSTLAGATVRITGNYASGEDVLSFVNRNGIAGSWDAGTGTLTLTGTATLADYEAALESVTYNDASPSPSALTRTVSFTVNDGTLDSRVATRDVNFTPDAAPAVSTTPGLLRYVDGEGWEFLDAGATASDSDSPTLVGATIAITSNYVNGQDVLGFTNQNGITGSWNAATGVLTLSGAASPAAYQAALRSVGYYWIAAAGTPGTRTITVTVTDGILTSAAATRTATISRLAADAYEGNDYSWLAAPVTLNDSGAGTMLNALISSGSDADWYRFTAPYGTTGSLTVTVGNVGGKLKVHAGLYDTVVGSLADLVPALAGIYGPKATADASSGNQAVTLNWTGLTGGVTYYLKVAGLSATTGIYDLGVTTAMMAPDALEANNTSGAASNVTGSLVSGNGACCLTALSLHRAGDEDWFRIDTPANTDGNLTARVSSLTGGLSGLVWVYQHYSWGDVPVAIGVYATWMPGGAGQAVVYNAQPNTTYFVRVDNFWSETGGYQLDVTLPLDVQARDAYEAGAGNNLSWLATPLTLSSNHARLSDLTIHNCADQDWFSFTPTVNGGVQVEVIGETGGLVGHIGLYSSPLGSLSDQYGGVYTTLFGPTREYNASAPDGTVVLAYTLHAWTTYYFKVSGVGATTGIYSLDVLFAPTGSAGDVAPDLLAEAQPR